MEKINKKEGSLFLILLAEIALAGIYIRLFSNTEYPLLVFIPLLVAAAVYTPIYILRTRNRAKGARLIHYTIILSAFIAACGGVAVLANYNEAGMMMIIASGIINAIVSCWILVYLYTQKKELTQKQEQIDSFKSFLYAIPMWNFPFLVNSIF